MVTYTIDDCKQHVSDKDCWLVVHGKVYDVTSFLEEHPGGYDVILTSSGKDATQDFEEIGHSNSAREMLNKYQIGEYAGGDSAPITAKAAASSSSGAGSGISFGLLIPLLLILAAVFFQLYLKK
ncbi:cytochrome b5 [Monoraphidium neglectum]|uniref:Cytochrome b5 n=1 Tax=Monoraphidium neglectum TaxID=145388 RepID=A0A0D2KTV1_9CHLO|nr:cytochrome b5 [Monoraphidium neglectum]KIY98883.1 cytochrome b5 [Monoraphidium neglectum]|eukprot:XP_013897903.1 cytochrome b5 [Monoraphidium neglectum]